MPENPAPVFLAHDDVVALLDLAEVIDAVRDAFRALATGALPAPPGVLGLHVDGGGLHVKAAAMDRSRRYIAAKVNANFPANPARFGLPTIQGVIVLVDGECGAPLAVMDSREITTLRTAAASAVAADLLALPDASTLFICGCGEQSIAHVRAMAHIRPIERVLAFDVDKNRLTSFTHTVATYQGLQCRPVASVADGLRQAQIGATCTPSHSAFVTKEMLHPGLFIAAVGADNPEKHEIEPQALAASRVVVDVLAQAATMGDLHHAIAAGVMSPADVHAELGQLIAGSRPARLSADEIFIFDSTGTAVQDVAVAIAVYERAQSGARSV